jgi:hypothetical protein
MFEELKELELLEIDGGTMRSGYKPWQPGWREFANPPRVAP